MLKDRSDVTLAKMQEYFWYLKNRWWRGKSKSPKTAASLTHGVDEQGGHEEADCDADGNLDHRCRDVEDDGVEAVLGGLDDVS